MGPTHAGDRDGLVDGALDVGAGAVPGAPLLAGLFGAKFLYFTGTAVPPAHGLRPLILDRDWPDACGNWPLPSAARSDWDRATVHLLVELAV
ncbi:hypothetical protein ACF061_37575 [Streptomyces sp. NPDC015220]|uniref:hypothetical protein n=1 Tax=Streptomyces sp. NPDC015220 TaxID=3364947 RepID=UPI0036F67040